MAEGEVTALKETLNNQSLVVKKLYTELEEERKASATAAEEALSMIWRLQEDKAAEKLEACHYKRMIEEKLHHAEESLVILEETLFEKEIEVASLKYHIQAYKQKLLRISINNHDIGTLRIFDYPIAKSGSFLDKRNLPTVRRNISMPAASFDQLCTVMDIIDDEDSYKQVFQEPILKATNVTRMPDSMLQEDANCFLSDDGLSASRVGDSMNYCSTGVDRENATAPSQTDVEQLKKCVHQLENEIKIMKREYYNDGKEQLKLVKEIHCHTIQSDIKDSEFKKCCPQNDSLVSLMEAMLSFWL